MRIWLIHLGELLPIDGNVRLYRYGALAEILAKHGHHVTRWAPTFVHLTKAYRNHEDSEIDLNEKYRLKLLHAGGYQKHLGWARHRFHQVTAHRFSTLAPRERKPDLILAAMPVPEMCDAAIRFGEQNQVPVVIDIRDLWPDAMLDRLPSWTRKPADFALRRVGARNRRICRSASAILGISQGFLDWGLKHAGRNQGPYDRVFPMGRESPKCHGEARTQAENFWDELGVERDGQLRCCFFGTMASLFDLETAIEGAKELRKSGDPIQLVLCGDGPKSSRYRKLAQGLGNVIMPGWVNPDQVAVLMERSHIGLVPYLRHVQSTLPNKAIDYLSAGLPVLCSRGGELATMVRNIDCGREYLSGNADSFVKVLRDLQASPQPLKTMGSNGLHYFERNLEACRIYGEMTEYFEELVCSTSRAGRMCA